MRFTATLEQHGKTATGIEVPPDIVDALGGGRQPAVVLTVGAHSYRTTVARRDGRALLPVSAANRAAAGVRAGDQLDLEIVLDTAPRTVEMPPELAAEPDLRAAWEALSYTHQREHAEAIEAARKPETRARRIEKAAAMLRAR